MKLLILALLALAGAVALALGVIKEPGYVLLGYGEWSAETSLAFLLLVMLVSFLLGYALLRLLAGLRRAPRRLGDWNQRRLMRQARNGLNRGLIALSEGQWAVAEKRLLKHVEASDSPLLNYLAAARAAQQQGAHERRDHYLRLAHSSLPEADIAVGLTQAELQIAHHQMEQALATLNHLRSIAPRHAHVLKMLMTLHLSLHDWQHLHDLLPELRKRKVIDEDEADRLEAQVSHELMQRAAEDGDLDQLRGLWNRLPRRLERDVTLQLAYAGHLQALGEGDDAEAVVRGALKHQWDDRLAYFYGQMSAGDAARQLSQGEHWLKGRESDPVLLLSLGRLAIRNRLWGKARSYLEASIGIQPTVESYQVLGSLLEQMDEPDEAMSCYRLGMLMASEGRAIALPAPTPEDTAEMAADGG